MALLFFSSFFLLLLEARITLVSIFEKDAPLGRWTMTFKMRGHTAYGEGFGVSTSCVPRIKTFRGRCGITERTITVSVY